MTKKKYQHYGKESYINRFLDYKIVKEVGITKFDIDLVQLCNLLHYYDIYDFRKSYEWQKQLAIWIKLGFSDFIERKQKLDLLGSQKINLETAIIKYGEKHGREIYKEFRDQALSTNKTNINYWLNQGYSMEDAKIMLSNEQKRRSNYISEEDELLWHNKNKEEIVKKKIKNRLSRRKYNPNGEEATVIKYFCEQNNINMDCCMYGTVKSQFCAIIDGKKKYYDLVVFDDVNFTNILYVVEYHGIGHINFSDYNESMENQQMKNVHFKRTYGYAYHNDRLKKEYIEKNYPNAKYIVFWREDYLKIKKEKKETK